MRVNLIKRTITINLTIAILSLLLTLVAVVADAANAPKPKYGANTTPMSQDRTYFQKNPAPDFWAITPYYVSQRDQRSCSLATFAAVFNALRSPKKLSAEDKLITQGEILDKADHPGWNRMFKQNGKTTSLQEFGEIAEKSLKLYGIEGKKVEVLHIDSQDAAITAKVREILVKNEKSSSDLVIANVLQSELTGDPEGAVGHMVSIGAFDAKKNRVFIFDSDREYYEPYWVQLPMLIQAMNTLDKDAGRNRGLIWIH